MPANTLFVLPTGNTAIKFSQIRDMYDQGDGDDSGFKKYYREGSVVGPSTYNTVYDPLVNSAKDIPITGDLEMSGFRGAYKEHIKTINSIKGPYRLYTNGSIDTNEKRTYRFLVTGNIFHSSTNSSWDDNGNGNPGINVDVPGSNTRVIIHFTSDGKIGGGPGKAGTGGNGGLGGVSGLPGSGSTTQGVRGGDADCTYSRSGTDGESGTRGGDGGHCILVTEYPVNETLYIRGYRDVNNVLIGFYPGGGGGGGAGGGSGGGAGETGGGGGKGAQGYNSSSVTEYEIYTPTTWWRREADSFNNNTYRWWVTWRGTTVYREYDYSYGNGGLSSVVGNDGVTYNKGSVRDNPRFDDDDLTFYENTNSDIRTYFDGGNGSDGRRGVNGSNGLRGGDGSMGRTLKSGGVLTTNDISGHSGEDDRADEESTNGYGAQSGSTGATGTCNAGNGGHGGNSGLGGGGGGYSAGGAGGGIGAAGSNGGTGRVGRDGLAAAITAQPGAENSCGGGDRSFGGAACPATSGGDDAGGPGGGGAAGTNLYNPIGASITQNL